jgi:hypothetical protein
MSSLPPHFANSRKINERKERNFQTAKEFFVLALTKKDIKERFFKKVIIEVQCNNDPLFRWFLFLERDTRIARETMSNVVKKRKRKKSEERKAREELFSLWFSECKCYERPRQDQFFHFDFVQLSSISSLRKKFHFMIEFYFLLLTTRSMAERKTRSFEALNAINMKMLRIFWKSWNFPTKTFF